MKTGLWMKAGRGRKVGRGRKTRTSGRARLPWVLPSLVFIGLVCVGQAAAEVQHTLPQAGLPSERERWQRLETPSFTILSSTSPERTLAVARQLEGLVAAIGHVTRLEADSPLPTQIYLFADNAALHPYKHLYEGEPASMSGALYSRPWGDYIAMNGARRAEASITVFHEYLHVVLRNNLPGLPLWLEEGLAELYQQPGIQTIHVPDLQGQLASYSTEGVTDKSNGHDTAYIIYTSGSTGKPKGTVICHHNISRVVRGTNYISIEPADRIIQLSNTAFDGSVFDIYGALLNGAELVYLPSEDASDIATLGRTITQQQVNVMFITTALFNMLVEYHLDDLKGIRKLMFGGERVSMSHAERALNMMGPNKLLHVYGPTESTVFATWYPINELNHHLGTVPIGGPLANTEIYVLNEALELVPMGANGELCIAGDGLAACYLGNEALTAEKFVPHPFKAGQRLYRTGDLCRWLSDGNIEFIGRIDQQVKIRGFRIEPGEVESQLAQIEGITENRVLVLERGGEKYLAAYYVAETEVDAKTLKAQLAETLPEYMIPAAFVGLEALPLNPSGKLDRKALPEPELATDHAYVPPTNETEAQLVDLWAAVLALAKEQIGIHTNFFEIGGHSINIIKLNHKVNEHFGTEVTVADMFRLPTIAQMAEYLEHGDQGVEAMAEQIDESLAEAEDTLGMLGLLDD